MIKLSKLSKIFLALLISAFLTAGILNISYYVFHIDKFISIALATPSGLLLILLCYLFNKESGNIKIGERL